MLKSIRESDNSVTIARGTESFREMKHILTGKYTELNSTESMRITRVSFFLLRKHGSASGVHYLYNISKASSESETQYLQQINIAPIHIHCKRYMHSWLQPMNLGTFLGRQLFRNYFNKLIVLYKGHFCLAKLAKNQLVFINIHNDHMNR